MKDANEETLRKFLQYATGADVICVQEIKVVFNKLLELNQRVVARTCDCLLEVPATYTSYLDFQSQFKTQLNSGYWEMDIA